MPIDKVWVIAEITGGSPVSTSLELLTKARSMASATEAVSWGTEVSKAAGELGNFGATTVHDVGDIGDALPGVPVAAAMAELVRAGNGPDVILVPTTYDGRDIAGRLSAMLDVPVITNVVGLEV
ncbi:MAG TPA: electron transfer flavoprotein subunit alpha/FixB family protein, partial [Acidimicrobiales bacterium]|nr:electron transfer flavoprotein subunit alpha/FixB family protein [Acidimicrobiales bacterium]